MKTRLGICWMGGPDTLADELLFDARPRRVDHSAGRATQALGAGYVSSAYKDVIAFVVILAVLFLRPDGLFGALRGERV